MYSVRYLFWSFLIYVLLVISVSITRNIILWYYYCVELLIYLLFGKGDQSDHCLENMETFVILLCWYVRGYIQDCGKQLGILHDWKARALLVWKSASVTKFDSSLGKVRELRRKVRIVREKLQIKLFIILL